ncbi:hypothetical protein C8R46DRAFT_1220384 [Mycena filopes]|nr:hypothetical protein C8R46DRAFT_1220384 [Mycena filopes]
MVKQCTSGFRLLKNKWSLLPPVSHYATRKTECRTQAVTDAQRGRHAQRAPESLTIDVAGVWAAAGPVGVFTQAVNLMRWVYRGDNYAAESMCHIVAHVGADPTQPRTIGKVTVLQNQNQAMAHFNSTVYCSRAPERANVTNPIPVGTPVTTPMAVDKDEPMPTAQDHPPPSITKPFDIAPPENPSVAVIVPADDTKTSEAAVFLGAAQCILPNNTMVHLGKHAATTETMARHSMTASISRVVRWYKNMPTAQWPLGMRVTETQWPSTLSAEPLWLDVGAWFTPRHNLFSSLHRSSCLKVVIRLLSVDGMFDHHADTGGYPFATLLLGHYPFDQHQLLRWPLSKTTRDRVANVDNPCETTFTIDRPHGPGNVGANMLRAKDLWSDMSHGPVRAGMTTSYPRHPGATLTALPITDITMENGEPFPQLPPVTPTEKADLRDGPRA